ncbi:MAG: hypothetical protein ACI4KF_02280 [Huintestinicola sp.]
MRVYIKTDEVNRITAMDSEAFISDFTGWIMIDEGNGDKYAHAQGNYLPKPLYDKYGRNNFMYEDGRIVEISEDEKPDVPEIWQELGG